MAWKATGFKRLGAPTTRAEDWEETALQLIAEDGVGALTVDALALRLRVTKGSFYWHFRSRSELLKAALNRWERRALDETIKGLEAIDDPRKRLEVMLDAASQAPRSRSIYAALAEAADEPAVRAVLNRVASVRVSYLEVCYSQLGLLPGPAKSKAVLAYAAYRGLLQLAHEAPQALPTDWGVYTGIVREALIPPIPKKTVRRRPPR